MDFQFFVDRMTLFDTDFRAKINNILTAWQHE